MYMESNNVLVLRVAGVTFNSRQTLISGLNPNDVLRLSKVNNNIHDEHAVAVLDSVQRQIGWIPQSHSKYVSDLLKSTDLEVQVLRILGGGEYKLGVEVIIKPTPTPYDSLKINLLENQILMSALISHSPQELKSKIDTIYFDLCRSFERTARFGPSGAKEFVGAIVLANIDNRSSEQIIMGVQQYFLGNWSPIEFSNFMDEVVISNSSIDYTEWCMAFRFLESNHTWIDEHTFAQMPIYY